MQDWLTWLYGVILLFWGWSLVREGLQYKDPNFFAHRYAGKWVAPSRLSSAAAYYSRLNVAFGACVIVITVLRSFFPAQRTFLYDLFLIFGSVWLVLSIVGLWLFSRPQA